LLTQDFNICCSSSINFISVALAIISVYYLTAIIVTKEIPENRPLKKVNKYNLCRI